MQVYMAIFGCFLKEPTKEMHVIKASMCYIGASSLRGQIPAVTGK